MKKLISLLLILTMLLCMAPAASAADAEATQAAETLYTLGLFRGTGTNADGTPIFDIKPYIPYGDCHPEALGGFTSTAGDFLCLINNIFSNLYHIFNLTV